jgi:hypothetical protein
MAVAVGPGYILAMYSRRQTRPKPLQSQPRKWDAPVAGWVSNRALASPRSIEGPGAAVLDNFFPRSTGVALRRGKELYATLQETDLDVLALFSYKNGSTEKLFGANEEWIYDLTSVPFASAADLGDEDGDIFETEGGDTLGWGSTDGLEVSGVYTGGRWIVVQFATTGGIYLIGVNGEDPGFIYDGDAFYPYVEGGVSRLDYDGGTVAFTEGETLTGGTSAATATIWKVEGDATSGYLLLTDVAGGPFDNDEVITDGDGGAAVADGVDAIVAPGITFNDGSTDFTSADMSFVWTYKNRLWFAQKDSLNAWYLDVDQIGGDATVFPMGGIFANGGALLFGARWSLESGGEGGLSEQNTFTTTNGEVAIYQGDSPDEASTWAIVGVYRIGSPLGNRAYLRGGGDLAIATSVGLVPLSKAIELDVTALNVATVSYKIADAWTDAIRLRGETDWQAMIWPENKLAAIAPPDLIGSSAPVVFVSNTETGAWARYTNWHALCMEVFQGQLYFGSPEGKVFKANIGGLDDGDAYSGAVVLLFDDLGAASATKIPTVAKATTRANTNVNDQLSMLADFNIEVPPAPDATPLTGTNTWGDGIWGTSQWGSEIPTNIGQTWRSAGNVGYYLAPCYQVTSGSVAAIDVELIAIDTLHTTAGAVS